MRKLWSVMMAWAILACASANAAEPNEAVLNAPQVFALASAYQQDGRTDDAETLLEALSRDRDVDVRAEARFRLGQARLARADYDGAIAAFAAVLEEKPEAHPTRIALAQALALAGRTGAAARELRRAQVNGLPEDVQRMVDRFSDVLRRSRPYGLTVELGLAPDSNINQATSSSTIDLGGIPLALDTDGQATSGIGITGSVDGFASLPVKKGLTLVSRVAGLGNFYRQGQFNDLYLAASSGPEFRLGPAVARVAGTYTWRQFGGDPYSNGWGGQLHVLAPLGRRAQLAATVQLSDQKYKIAEQNGLQSSLSLSYESAITPRLYARAEGNLARAEARAKAYANLSYGGSVSLSRDLGPVTIYTRAAYTRTDGDGPFALFGATRADDRYDFTAGASWTRWTLAGLSPTLRLQQTINSSPLDLYSFKRTRVEIAVMERF